MKTVIRQIILIIFAFAFSMTVTGCGSGGSSTVSRSTKAKTSVKTAGLVAPGLLVGALEIVISIPYGVTVECITGTNEPVQSVVQLVGTADPKMLLSAMNYTPATPTNKGSLKIQYYNAVGFTPSDSLLVQLDIATGFFPIEADFSLTKYDVVAMSADGNTIYPVAPVLNPVFGVSII